MFAWGRIIYMRFLLDALCVRAGRSDFLYIPRKNSETRCWEHDYWNQGNWQAEGKDSH
jgi:hypothetical protein